MARTLPTQARWLAGLGLAVLLAAPVVTAGVGDRFTYQGSIANTRHNMTQSTAGTGAAMDGFRNDYGEVCVYCHTPHGAANVQLPLWNRTIKQTNYTTYDTLGSSSLTQAVTQPGVNSLACLSCHDGQVAVDSVINMPGSGGYKPSQATSQDNAFLNTWKNPSGANAAVHWGLKSNTECMACHSGALGAITGDFSAFALGTDLSNDHPVGIRLPAAGPGVDFNQPDKTVGNVRFFDNSPGGAGNNRPDKQEVRFYDTGDGFEVECASCHDPHGVPSGAAGSKFLPSFLRVTNTGSTLCLTCHTK